MGLHLERRDGCIEGRKTMTRKDFEFLARTFYLCMASGELKPMTVRVMAAEIDKQYPNFNRDQFEAACQLEKFEK